MSTSRGGGGRSAASAGVSKLYGKNKTSSSGGGGFDPQAYAIQEILGRLNDQGTYVPGTPGYTISRAGERAAAQASFRQAEADRAKLYKEAVDDVLGRAPGIREGYQRATDDLQKNVTTTNQRMAQDQEARDMRVLAAAQAMGLNVAPPTKTRSDEVVAEFAGAGQNIADAWRGFNANSGERAVERNTAVADAFTWQGAQQQAALQQLLSQTLAGLVDQYVAGTAGRVVGGLKESDRRQYLGLLSTVGKRDHDMDISAANLALKGAPVYSTTRGPNGVTTKVTHR